MAGLGVIFYAMGYLINRGHLVVLGIYGLFDASYVELITEGVMFALTIAYFIGEVLLPLAALFAVAALTAGLVLWLSRYFGLTAHLRELALPFTHWTHRPPLNAVLYFALLLLFLKHYDLYFESFQAPLAITSVLYRANASQNGSDALDAACRSPNPSETTQIRCWLEQRNTARALAHFRELFWGEVFAAMLLAGAWRVTVNWRWRLLWVSPFAISFVIYTVYLPMVYGILVDPMEYPVITLDPAAVALVQSSGKLFLLNQTDQNFVLWDSQGKRVLWIPTSQVKWAAILQTENLFGPPEVRN